MTNNDWPPQLTARVAAEIRRYRKERALTVQDLATACEALGLVVPKTTITNLETGRRASVDLAEFLVLAKVLDVPPILLLFPLDTTATVESLPHQVTSTWDAAAWFTGETPVETQAPSGSPLAVLNAYRAHADAVRTALVSTRLAKDRRRKANVTLDSQRRAQLLTTAAQYEELAFQDCQELRAARTTMTAAGLAPPGLPQELSFVDAAEENEDTL
jgi:transcriptional regulator with XRE-family HTH domain